MKENLLAKLQRTTTQDIFVCERASFENFQIVIFLNEAISS